MPNIKSAKKRVKVNAVKRMQNKIQKSQMKTELKSLTAKISETKDAKLLSEAYKTLDQAVAKEFFVNVNDGTNEGIRYLGKPVYSVQFHPEACGGPKDTEFLFDMFINMMEVRGNN